MTRRNAREQAFFVLFEKIFDNDSAVSEIVKKAEENDLIKLNGFARELLSKYEIQRRNSRRRSRERGC